MIPIEILPQPDDTTCGPTSLHAIYNYYKDQITLPEVISQVSYLETGGTLAVMLACHALKRGYSAVIYTYNLNVFDPTWFANDEVDIAAKLKQQIKCKASVKLHRASAGYLEFISLGGELRFKDLTSALLRRYFKRNIPIITGLSATYLYNTAREFTLPTTNELVFHDVKGYPSGHFVVLCGYDFLRKNILVADPYTKNTISGANRYSVNVDRLINSIMLGALTYDANFLIIEPKSKTGM